MQNLRERQKLARRTQILDAARELFEEHGYSKTNMEDISARAAVGVATIYTYFGSKEGVLAELFKESTHQILSEVDGLFDNLPTAADQLVMAVLKTYEKGLVSQRLMKIFMRQSVDPGLAKDAMEECRTRQYGQMEAALVKGQANGALSSNLNVAIAAQVLMDLHFHYLDSIARGNFTRTEALRREEESIRVILENWRAD